MTKQSKTVLIVIVVVVAVGLVGWLLGRFGDPANNSSANNTTQSSGNANGTDVKSLISYTLPDGWSENTCAASTGTVYIIPAGVSLNCDANPSSPIKAYVDPQNTTDCQQLKPTTTTGIKKHVCISLYIDNHKSLKASTTYAAGSSYGTETTISDYYINTGRGVVAIQYTYTSANDYQIGFDQLATSVKDK